jgi:hypothetical protein
MTEVERFWSKVEKGDGCWRWRGWSAPNGYGIFDTGHSRESARKRLAHRYAYIAVHGSIPEGMDLDHQCNNRWCVNPAHLVPMTHRENVLRSDRTPASINARKTHCPEGHALTPDNCSTEFVKSGRRVCAICRKQKRREWNRRAAERRRQRGAA